jgi:radical SAM protein with 4Fe4S-binding SPASM domain
MAHIYPLLGDNFALRQIGSDLYYLMNARSGDYYELEIDQLELLRAADGTRALDSISNTLGINVEDAAAFVDRLQADGFVEVASEPARIPRLPHYRYSKPPHLSDVLIEVTGFCNLRCAHCFNSEMNTPLAISKQMTEEEILRLIAELDDMNVRRIQLSGGEPLLRKDLWTIIEAIDEHRMFLDVISTNATAITQRNVERFAKRFAHHGALYISMDGLTPAAYESIRGQGVFPKFDRAIHLLDAAGCRIFINTMAVRTNLHEMDALYDWMASHPSVKGWRIGLPKVLGRYREFHQSLELEFSEVIGEFKRLLQRWLIDRPSFRLELSDFFRTDSFETGLEDHQPDDSPCKYSLGNMSIKPDGTAVFCASLETYEPAVLGNVVRDGVDRVWHGERHLTFRQARVADLDACAKCRYTRLCGGGCRSNALLSYGNIRAPDPRACIAMEMLEREILPELPSEFRERVTHLIDPSRSFTSPTSFRHFI